MATDNDHPGQRQAADMRNLQDLFDRRGRNWIMGWLGIFDGPDQTKLADAIATNVAGWQDYERKFPNCPDPRD